MPSPRPVRPRRRPLNPRDQARRMALIDQLTERLDRLAAAVREKRRQDRDLPGAGAVQGSAIPSRPPGRKGASGGAE